MTRPELVAAAQAALDAHAVMRAVREEEPVDEDGEPTDDRLWLAWRQDKSAPAYAQWDAAMRDLNTVSGLSFNRHPWSFAPLCQRIIAGEDITQDDCNAPMRPPVEEEGWGGTRLRASLPSL